MWSVKYKGYYIQGNFNSDDVTVIYSPVGFGYEWRKECKSLHAAKIAITKHTQGSTYA
jgi:hypothetical protein